jgi:hypothetical protein
MAAGTFAGQWSSAADIRRTLIIHMIHPTRILVTAAFSLLSVLSSQAANIKISSLPFNITAPGTYVLTGNLTFASGNQAGINVISNVSGPVVVDLKGFILAGPGAAQHPSSGSVGVLIGTLISGDFTPPVTGSLNTYPITIRNGTISHCTSGIYVGQRTDVTINNIAFIEPADFIDWSKHYWGRFGTLKFFNS